MNALEWLALTDCEATAYKREMRRIPLPAGEFAAQDIAAVLAFEIEGLTIQIWYVGWHRLRQWFRPKIVNRAGIWVREASGKTVEKSWDVSIAVVNAVARSAQRFQQLEKHARWLPARLDVCLSNRILAAGVPRSGYGGIARSLIDDAKTHCHGRARWWQSSLPTAIAYLDAWARDEMLYGEPCEFCVRALQTELSIALGPDEASDERRLLVKVCEACDRRVLVLDEESRRGASSRSRQHEVDAGTARMIIVRAMRDCPDRNNPNCACPGHTQARATARADHDPRPSPTRSR